MITKFARLEFELFTSDNGLQKGCNNNFHAYFCRLASVSIESIFFYTIFRRVREVHNRRYDFVIFLDAVNESKAKDYSKYISPTVLIE